MEILRSPKATNAKLSALRHRYNAQKYLQDLAIDGAKSCFDHRLYVQFSDAYSFRTDFCLAQLNKFEFSNLKLRSENVYKRILQIKK